ncbi:MAG: type II toxin-antitoxin system HipA family toxin [Myxococcota bacterium]
MISEAKSSATHKPYLAHNQAYVFVQLPHTNAPVPAGKVAVLGDDGPALEFFYGRRYLARKDAIALDPLHLPLTPQRFYTQQSMFGALRDASPDSWGRFLVEKRLGVSGLTEIDYLLQGGTDPVGALNFSSASDAPPRPPQRLALSSFIELTRLMEAFENLEQHGKIDTQILDLLQFGSSMGGARPKAVVEDSTSLWLAKLNRPDDRMNYVRVEHATMTLALACGLNVPTTRVVTISNRDLFLIRRFDRDWDVNSGQYRKKHFLSALTITGRTEMESPRSSYGELAQLARTFCHAPKQQNQELFRRMIFNVLCNNADDHLRNHGFLREDQGYVLSPAYDILPLPQATYTHYLHLGLGQRGKEATLANALSDTVPYGLSRDEARNIALHIQSVTRAWETHFRSQGVSQNDIESVRDCFRACNEEI